MRTLVILFATLLTATAAAAAPRSLSTGEPATVDLPAQKVQVLEAPKVELAPPAPTAQTDTTRTTPAPAPQPETKATESAPAPVVTAPAPAATKPVVAAPTVPTAPVQASKPVKQAAVQRKPRQRQAAGGVYIPRELRGMERSIAIGIGAAALSYGLANVPYYW